MELLYCCCLLILISLLLFLFKPAPPRNSSKLPPGPRQLPIIGNIHQMCGPLPHRTLRDLAKPYGPLMHLKLGEVPYIVVSSPAAAREVMKTHDFAFADRKLSRAIEIVSYGGKSLTFAPYGDYWINMRKIFVTELLSPKRLHSFRSIREDEVRELIISVSSSSGAVVNLSDKIVKTVNDIVTRAAIGRRWIDILEMIKEVVRVAAGNDLSDLFPSFTWITGPLSKSKYEVLEYWRRKIDPIIEGIIEEHKDGSGGEGRGYEDWVDVLLRLQKDGALGDQCELTIIKAIITDMIGAASETSSTAILWAIAELMRNRRVMSKMQSELRNALKGKAEVTESDIKDLKYFHHVVKETLRLHPPAPLLVPQLCQKSCNVLGYEIPEKTRVIVNAWAIGRNPQHWKDAEEFRPERFERSLVDFKGASFEFLPFGAGRRMCPGMLFGLANVELPLAQLMYYFDWELPCEVGPHELDMDELFGLTARRRSDLCLRPISRIPHTVSTNTRS